MKMAKGTRRSTRKSPRKQAQVEEEEDEDEEMVQVRRGGDNDEEDAMDEGEDEDEEGQQQQNLPRLKFSLKLSSKQTTAELLKRLKTLHQELTSFDQDLVDKNSLDNISKELIHPGMFLHKDRGVKAYVADCLADLLRLYAPEAPWDAKELKDIFQFFFRQLRNLQPPADDPYYAQYFYLLESLSQVRSVYLVCDLPGSDELMAQIFSELFDKVKDKDLPKNIIMAMTDIMSLILEESHSVPAEVLETLMAQFFPENAKRSPTAYRMVTDVCSPAPVADKLQRNVSQYFAELILSSVESSDPGPPSTETIKSHQLIKSIALSCPTLLLNVIPQLETELLHENAELRMMVSKMLGEMWAGGEKERRVTNATNNGQRMGGEEEGKRVFDSQATSRSQSQRPPASQSQTQSTYGNGINGSASMGMGVIHSGLASMYQSTWKAWLGRAKDKSPSVRIVVIEALGPIWRRSPELGVDIQETLCARLLDPDDKVRQAACAVVSAMDYETALHSMKKDALKMVGDRCKDKKHAVQAEAHKALGRLFHAAYSDIEARDEDAIDKFAWIAAEIFSTYALSEKNVRNLSESTAMQYILPLPTTANDEVAWVERLLVVMGQLDDKATMCLIHMTNLQERRNLRSPFDFFIDYCEKYNGGVIEEDESSVTQRLKATVRTIADIFPDSQKAADELLKFAKANENRLYKILRTLMDPLTDLKTLLKTRLECFRRIEGLGGQMLSVFETFIARSSFQIVNRSSVPTLIKKIQRSNQVPSQSQTQSQLQLQETTTAEFAASAKTLLDVASKGCPMVFKPHVPELVRALNEDNAILREVCLKALSEVARMDQSILAGEKRLPERATAFARDGTPAQAKYAATIIALDKARLERCHSLVEELAGSLKTDEPDRLLAHLSALARLAKHAPDSVERKSDVIVGFIIKNLLMQSDYTQVDEEEEEDAPDWIDDHELEDLDRSRLVGLKVLINRCVAYASTENATGVSASVFKFLWSLIDNRGKVSQVRHSPAMASRLRLTAANSVLKLAAYEVFEKEIGPRFEILALTAQDTSYEVRYHFVHKLASYLLRRRITNPRYNLILFLVAHDPERDMVEMAKESVARRSKSMDTSAKAIHFDYPLVRLIHLLAHHPDFTMDADDIKIFTKYIEFYINCVMRPENVSFLHHLALKLKTIRDGESDKFSRYIYTLAELTQHVIRALAKQHNWAITPHPGHVKMPGDIFKSFKSAEDAQKVAKTSYLSDEMVKEIGTIGKPMRAEIKPKAPRKPKEPAATRTPRKRKSSPSKNPKAKSSGGRSRKRPKYDKWDGGGKSDEGQNDDSSEDFDDDSDGAYVLRKKPKTATNSASRAERMAKRAKDRAEDLDKFRSDPMEVDEGDAGGSPVPKRATQTKAQTTRPGNPTTKATTAKRKGKGKGKAKASDEDTEEEDDAAALSSEADALDEVEEAVEEEKSPPTKKRPGPKSRARGSSPKPPKQRPKPKKPIRTTKRKKGQDDDGGGLEEGGETKMRELTLSSEGE